MSYKNQKIGSLKVGKYLIDPKSNQVCKVLAIRIVSPGKHGSAKAIVKMVGVFDAQKRELKLPADRKISVPMVDKRIAQVVNINPKTYSLMDCETYDHFELEISEDQTIRQKVEESFNNGRIIYIEYHHIMGQYRIEGMKEDENFI